MVKGAFDFWDRNGKIEFEAEDVRIYDVDGHKYLFVNQTLYASTTERSWYVKNVMPSAHGRCLEIGLGLGVASKAILAKKGVQHLLTIEENEQVIAAFGKPLPRHIILNADIYEWVKNIPSFFPAYDFIFVDHFADMDDEDTYPNLYLLVEKLKSLLKPGGKIVVWIDENAPDEDKEKFRDLWIV